LALVLGAAAFCALGFALSGPIPSENTAVAVTNAIVLPLYFVSGVFIPDEQLPGFMQAIGDLFPIKHLYQALLAAFDPTSSGPGIEPLDLAVVAAWGVVGFAVALRTFRWAPRTTS
jgi:ABC-2 type transport system permease protein